MAKRERERTRLLRQEDKRVRRQAAVDAPPPPGDAANERLWDEYRILSERFDKGAISEMKYSQERQRIFQELGLDDPDS
jgi:hypothetical protein